MKLTDDQQKAVYGKGGLLVSAAAGSGKTAVLVERIVRLLMDEEHPIDADRFLVVTFTKAAASEMRSRLMARLSDELAKAPGNIRLMRQQALLNRANISTMDSFCLNLIRENFQYLDLPPDFSLAGNGQLTLLQNQAMEEMLEHFYQSDDGSFTAFIELLGADRGDDALVTAVNSIFQSVRSLPFPEDWLEEAERMYTCFDGIASSRWGQILLEEGKECAADLLARLEKILPEVAQDEKMNKVRGTALQSWYRLFAELIKALDDNDWDAAVLLTSGFSPVPYTGKLMKYEDTAFKQRVDDLVDSCKSGFAALQKMFSMPAEECSRLVQGLAPQVSLLFACVTDFMERYQQLKNRKGILDFADVEYAALSLLIRKNENGIREPTPWAAQISEQYDAVLVDEYQDTNHLQHAIFYALSGQGERLFVVGDVKQSIYRFRQASPEIFLSLLAQYPLYDAVSPKSKVILDKNFRSREEICQSVNFFFRLLMSEKVGEMAYTREHFLFAEGTFSHSDEPAVELTLIERGDSELSPEALEARQVAGLIREMMERECVTDAESGHLRKARFGDFAVLLRSTKKRAGVYLEELKKQGIPVWCEQKGGLLETREVAYVLSFLKVLNNPTDDVALLSAMLSPFVGFSPDEMAEIRLACRRDNLYTAVLSCAQAGSEKCADFLQLLEEMRQSAAILPADRLLSRLYDRLGILSMVQAMDGGAQRSANLLLLTEYARECEAGGYQGLSSFLRYLDRLAANQTSLDPASVSAEEDDVVKIMSIHRSKGLQFPVCILAANFARFNRSDSKSEMVVHRAAGIGLTMVDDAQQLRRTTFMREAVSALIERAAMSEELRVLYVAMTRAQDKLVMLHTGRNIAHQLGNLGSRLESEWSAAVDSLEPAHVLHAANVSDWLLSCALVHPDGAQLRSMADVAINPFPNQSRLCVRMIEAVQLENQLLDSSQPEQTEQEPARVEEELVRLVEQRLSFRYPYAALNGVAAKRSVSQMVKEKSEEDRRNREYFCTSRPRFMEQQGMTPAEKGTALHAFLQYADYAAAKNNPAEEVRRLVSRAYLSERQGEVIDLKRIETFFHGGLYQRMEQAVELKREVRFMAELPASRLDPSLSEELGKEPVVVQGIADCIFVEKDGLVILDYKTDRVKNMELLKETYAPQLEVYAEALSQSYRMPVKEKLLYSFYLQDVISV